MSKVIVEIPKNFVNGVKPEISSRIVNFLNDGRRFFGSPGAALSQQRDNPAFKDSGINAESASIGMEGERATASLLSTWMSNKPDVVAIHSMHVRGAGKEDVDPETGIIEGGDTDHMLVIGDEVILIDSKRWKKGGYSIDDSGKVLRFKKSFAGGSRMHMKQAMHIWLDYLDSSARISGIVCINCEEAYVVRDRNWYTCPYRLVESDKMVEFLDDKYSRIGHDHINSTLVSQIVVCCVPPYDPRTRVIPSEVLNRMSGSVA